MMNLSSSVSESLDKEMELLDCRLKVAVLATLPEFQELASHLAQHPEQYAMHQKVLAKMGVDLEDVIARAVRESEEATSPITIEKHSPLLVITDETLSTVISEAKRFVDVVLNFVFGADGAYHGRRATAGAFKTSGEGAGGTESQESVQQWRGEIVIGSDTLCLTAVPDNASRVVVVGVVDNPRSLKAGVTVALHHPAFPAASAKQNMILSQVPGSSRLLGRLELRMAWSEFNREGHKLVPELGRGGAES